MSVLKIEHIALRLGKQIVDCFKAYRSPTRIVSFDRNGALIGNFKDLFSHQGLYGFLVSKKNKSAIVYIGKSEGKRRLRQHLTGKNLDGSPLSASVKNKHESLKRVISDGFTVHLCVYADRHFGKASLSCLEIAAALYAKSDCENVFPTLKHWNTRIG